MKRFVVATANKGKLKEIAEILSAFQFDILSMKEAGVNKDIEEYGTTFEENAMIKAREVAKITGAMVMADDSGLEVDFLNGAPGIYSARFAGEGATDADKNNKLLGLMKDVPFEERTARFVCAIAVVFPNGESFCVRGTCEGYIAMEPTGENGFGYDPLFYIPEFDRTMAELDSTGKNKVSHRGKALKLMVEEIKKHFKTEVGR